MRPKTIHEFRGENYFLSNFYASPVTYNGITYQNNESAFQSQKDLSRSHEFAKLPPNKAKSLGRRVKLRPDWEQVKESIMYDIVRAKFSQNPKLKQKLIATGDAKLIEGNYWHDNYWGNCTCNRCRNKTGLNKLGEILMNIRYEFQSEN